MPTSSRASAPSRTTRPVAASNRRQHASSLPDVPTKPIFPSVPPTAATSLVSGTTSPSLSHTLINSNPRKDEGLPGLRLRDRLAIIRAHLLELDDCLVNLEVGPQPTAISESVDEPAVSGVVHSLKDSHQAVDALDSLTYSLLARAQRLCNIVQENL